MMMRTNLVAGAAVICLVSACKPPPTDADLTRELPESVPTFASKPLASPDTEGAQWVETSPRRIVYGIPGKPAQMALECLPDKDEPKFRITRISPADEGAGALLALIGNGAIGRIEVDAVEIGGRFLWQGEVRADDPRLDPLIGDKELTATVPGAGLVKINPGPLPAELLAICRGIPIEEVLEPPAA